MNENLFASFISTTMMELPFVVLIVMRPSMLMTSSKWLISNRFHSFQQWLVKLMLNS